jgi:hypothetical protein
LTITLLSFTYRKNARTETEPFISITTNDPTDLVAQYEFIAPEYVKGTHREAYAFLHCTTTEVKPTDVFNSEALRVFIYRLRKLQEGSKEEQRKDILAVICQYKPLEQY